MTRPADDWRGEVFALGPRITVLPVIHGSGDFAWEVRQRMLSGEYNALAVPLPASFQRETEQAILELPRPSVVVQEQAQADSPDWGDAGLERLDFSSGDDVEDSMGEEDDLDDVAGEEGEDLRTFNYVPIDPCQPVIAAVRAAMGEHCPRYFIDLETEHFVPYGQVLPDPYALKMVSLEAFASSMLPAIQRPQEVQRLERIKAMAGRLRELALDHDRILFVCSVLDWPWIREAYFEAQSPWPEPDEVSEPITFPVQTETLYFLFGELPFITSLYEHARAELSPDRNLAIDGVKELLIAARQSYQEEFRGRARRITPSLLKRCLQYIRNLTLLERRLSPELTTIVIAAKQMAGDQYALHVLERAKEYDVAPHCGPLPIKMGIGRATLPDRPDEPVVMISRLPGPPLSWKRLELVPRPSQSDQDKWRQQWDPRRQCSWPPEDEMIENFRSTVFDRAREVMGTDLAKTEKFTSSIKDGIDIRDTLRNWHEGSIYVKELPPNLGNLDAAVMLFDSPADPRDYPWRTTWYAEHEEESTLAFFATNMAEQVVGPGICVSQYGGALFLFPPRTIPDIWSDRRLDFTETLEERVLAAACLHSTSRHIALLSPLPPGPGWRQLARNYGKQWVHLPLGQFSESTLQRLRQVHVLNGQHVRSYAAHFIRRP